MIGAAATLAATVLTVVVAVYLARRKRRVAPTDGSTTAHQTASGSGSAAQISHARDVTINQGADVRSFAEGIARGVTEAHLDRFADYEA